MCSVHMRQNADSAGVLWYVQAGLWLGPNDVKRRKSEAATTRPWGGYRATSWDLRRWETTNVHASERATVGVVTRRPPARRLTVASSQCLHGRDLSHRAHGRRRQDKRTTKPNRTILLRDHRRVSSCSGRDDSCMSPASPSTRPPH